MNTPFIFSEGSCILTTPLEPLNNLNVRSQAIYSTSYSCLKIHYARSRNWATFLHIKDRAPYFLGLKRNLAMVSSMSDTISWSETWPVLGPSPEETLRYVRIRLVLMFLQHSRPHFSLK